MMVRGQATDPWREAFTMRLRLLDVSGARIGEALAEVDTHCADAGQSPQEAFGDPHAYAESLARGIGSPDGSRGSALPWKSAVATLFTLTGVTLVFEGVDSVSHRMPGTLTAGHVVSIVAGTLGIAAIVGLLFRKGGSRRRVDGPLIVSTVVCAAVLVLLQVVWRTPLVHVAGWLLLCIGVPLLVAAWLPLATGRLLADRIVDPRTGAEPQTASPVLIAVFRFGLPVMLLLAVVLIAVLPGLAS